MLEYLNQVQSRLPPQAKTSLGPDATGRPHFQDVTGPSGVGGSGADWSTAAAWVDIDNDGDLDLFVANYVHWSKDTDIAIDYKLPGIGRA